MSERLKAWYLPLALGFLTLLSFSGRPPAALSSAVALPQRLVYTVSDYSEQTPVAVGDVVETSSRGGLFPRGVTVGRIVRVLPKDANALTREFLARPSASVDVLLEVALIRPL